mmetsp:Transcript_4002/g.14006  ORF Transcript_4002/g.14006 Transcript_4002/m.14006 type:complete len:94 (+) Transcript_4002:132-413(+)
MKFMTLSTRSDIVALVSILSKQSFEDRHWIRLQQILRYLDSHYKIFRSIIRKIPKQLCHYTDSTLSCPRLYVELDSVSVLTPLRKTTQHLLFL